MAKEFGGIALPVEGLTRALGISIINETEWMGGGTFGKVMGPNGSDTCSIAHLPQWQKVVGKALEIMKRDEDALSGSVPLIGAEHFFLFAQLLGRGGVSNTFAMTPGDFMDPEDFQNQNDWYPLPGAHPNKPYRLAASFRINVKDALGPFELQMDNDPPILVPKNKNEQLLHW